MKRIQQWRSRRRYRKFMERQCERIARGEPSPPNYAQISHIPTITISRSGGTPTNEPWIGRSYDGVHFEFGPE